MTKTFQIITDSSCDLPQSLADELDLREMCIRDRGCSARAAI